jgi:hypothetical protein
MVRPAELLTCLPTGGRRPPVRAVSARTGHTTKPLPMSDTLVLAPLATVGPGPAGADAPFGPPAESARSWLPSPACKV